MALSRQASLVSAPAPLASRRRFPSQKFLPLLLASLLGACVQPGAAASSVQLRGTGHPRPESRQARGTPRAAAELRRELPDAERSVVFSACGAKYCKQAKESLMSLAAQLLLDQQDQLGSKHYNLSVHVIADTGCSQTLADADFARLVGRSVKLSTIDIDVLDTSDFIDVQEWAPCAAARFYIPRLIPSKHVLYLDSDTRIVSSIEPLFKSMEDNSNAALFMADEVINCSHCGWYHRNGQQALAVMAGPNGYNSGVVGMNLGAWNARDLDKEVEKIADDYAHGRIDLVMWDQDLLNLMCKRQPELLHVLGCEYNFRTDSHCSRPPSILHGNRHVLEPARKWFGAEQKLHLLSERVLRSARLDLVSMLNPLDYSS
eukprot:TRINITY_DN55530_c0_g1_i1.p1 TRINITY_DN55530_c0_g1~~TRINITY_DN55530_c0_g1_i1.p1  ORF type:complete len:433 (-),score=45.39 TRINITY_DN55530_c0_g1_i1:278-1399(-)